MEAPRPRSVSYLRGLWSIGKKNPLPMLLQLLRAEGDLIRLPAGPYLYLLAQHPDHAEHVLQANYQNYRKSFNYRALRIVMGDGLLTLEGDAWKRQRRLSQPAFHRPTLLHVVEEMARCARDLCERWEKLPDGTVLDVAEEMTRLTLRIAGRTLFSVEVEGDASGFAGAVTLASRFVVDRTRSIIRLPVQVPTPGNLRVRRALGVLDRVVYRIIEDRRRSANGEQDLLSLLMHAKDADTGEAMSDLQLRDEVLTFLSAGHETTANALTWTLYLLSAHPAERRRLEAEVQTAGGDLQKLPFTKSVIEESLRLYPPAWFIERQANEEDRLGDYRVARNAVVGLCPFTLHRDPRFWDDPEGFDPDRFSPAASAGRPRFAYLPFGAGPRTCIGAQFALWELQTVLATLCARFRLDLVPGHPIELDPLVTLRSKHGMKMAIHKRTS